MAKFAEALTLERLPEALVAAPRAAVAMAFEPENFFLGRTEGAGVLRDAFGRITRRCQITTEGGFSSAQGVLRFNETFFYDDGEIDIWRWVVQPGREGRYVATESKAGPGIVGERQGDDYVIAFRRAIGRASGPIAPRFKSRFTLLSPDLALKRAAVSLFGLPLSVLTAFHRRVG